MRYAELIANSIEESMARKEAEIFCNEMKEGKNYLYATRYAALMVENNLEEVEARKLAEEYAKKFVG